MARFKVYISDYDYGDYDVEKSVLEPVGAEVIGLQCRTGAGLAEQAADADAILPQLKGRKYSSRQSGLVH